MVIFATHNENFTIQNSDWNIKHLDLTHEHISFSQRKFDFVGYLIGIEWEVMPYIYISYIYIYISYICIYIHIIYIYISYTYIYIYIYISYIYKYISYIYICIHTMRWVHSTIWVQTINPQQLVLGLIGMVPTAKHYHLTHQTWGVNLETLEHMDFKSSLRLDFTTTVLFRIGVAWFYPLHTNHILNLLKPSI